MRFIWLMALFMGALLGAEEPLVVHLKTDERLMPTYVMPMQQEGKGFTSEYVRTLSEILRFDLNFNGMTRVVENKNNLDRLPLSSISSWRDQEIFFVVKPRLIEGTLHTEVLSVYRQSLGKVADIPLTGDLTKDRAQIHLVADALYAALFDQQGIASTHLLYTLRVLGGNDWISDVWESNYDGYGARKVTRGAGYSVTPTYLPPQPGKRCGSFFFVSYKTGQPKMYVSSLKEGVGRRLSTLPGNQLMPVCSNRRDKIAFISDATGNPDLFLQEFGPEVGVIGQPRQIFAARHATQGSPTFSPDGSRVAFVSNKDGSPRIYVMDIPDVGVPLKKIKISLLTKFQKGATAPSWSPNGTKIAYCARVEGVRQICVHDLARDEDIQLTSGSGNKENPTWAPNSLVLAYNSIDGDASELHLVTLKEPQSIRISLGAGAKHYPAWESRSY